MFGVVAGSFAAIPILHQSNPELLQVLLGRSLSADSAPALSMAEPEPVAVHEPDPSGRKVRIEGDGRGHFVADFRLNGQRIEAMVDTGATVVAINRSTARRIGLDLALSDFVHSVDTANGRTRAAGALIDRLEIGRIEVRDVQAVVLDDEALGGTLIGMSFLNRLRKFGVENGTLLLEQ